MDVIANRKAWVAALRSGEYQQGKGFLRDCSNQFCCLGVACDLAIKAGLDGLSWDKPALDGYYALVDLNDPGMSAESICRHTNIPSKTVAEWLGLAQAPGSFDEAMQVEIRGGGAVQLDALWKLNDRGNFPFKQIADVIESEPAGLFIKETANVD